MAVWLRHFDSAAPMYVLYVTISLHKTRPSTTLYYKACTKHVPVLHYPTKLAQSTSQYYYYYYYYYYYNNNYYYYY